MTIVCLVFGWSVLSWSASGALDAKASTPAVPPNLSSRVGEVELRKFCEILKGTYPSFIPLAAGAAAGAESPGKLYSVGDCVGTSGKGPATMTKSARTATLVVLLCLPVLALSDLAAWAKHHRVGQYFSGPCPDRCKTTRLSICSACMGGIKTCAQQHVCSNNLSVVCGDESTVSVPCWNQRYHW